MKFEVAQRCQWSGKNRTKYGRTQAVGKNVINGITSWHSSVNYVIDRRINGITWLVNGITRSLNCLARLIDGWGPGLPAIN